jgi:hypothetical protein
MNVLPVKNTELKFHHIAHVNKLSWNVTVMDLVVNVITDVKNVVNMMIG